MNRLVALLIFALGMFAGVALLRFSYEARHCRTSCGSVEAPAP